MDFLRKCQSLALQIRSLTKWGMVSENMTEDRDWPYQKVEYRGRGPSPSIPWYPYGYHASPLPDEICIVLAVGGAESARVHLTGSPAKRPQIAPGESVMYHPPTGSYLKFKADGSIEIKGNVSIIGELDVSSDSSFSAIVTSNGQDISDTHTHGTGSYIGDGNQGTPSALDSGSSGVPDS